MNADRLLAYYEQVADAPDAVARLRRFILDLAVRGKLNDYSGKDSECVLLGEIAEFIMGQAPPGSSCNDNAEGTIFVKVGEFGARYPQRRAWTTQPLKFALEGDVLICVVGATIGKLNLGISCSIGRSVAAVRPRTGVDQVFLYYSLMPFTMRLREEARGTAQSVISRQDLHKVKIWLPPVAEQQRIVTKVDELFDLCDRLEAARANRETARDRLAAASVAYLSASKTVAPRSSAPASNPLANVSGRTSTSAAVSSPKHDADGAFIDHSRFGLDVLPTLTARPEQIKALRQTILNLAVRGKLMRQNSEDEPALELLDRVERERKLHVTNRMIRGAEPPAQPCAKMEGFELPSSWQLCSLGQITLITDPNPSHRYPDYTGGTVPLLSTREFKDDIEWDPRTAKLTTNAAWEAQREICNFSEGDIVFARKGRLGLPRPLPKLEKFTFSHTLFVIKPIAEIHPPYLLWTLRRDEVISWLTKEMNQNTGVPTLGKAKTERLPIPLPPLAEQYRIVLKIDALMVLCDKLEASLTTAADTRRRLLDALLAEALAPDEDRLLEAAE